MELEEQLRQWQSNNLAKTFIDRGDADSLAEALYRMEGLDASVAAYLIENGMGRRVCSDLASFQPEAHPAIANLLFSKGAPTNSYVLAKLKDFQNLDHFEVATKAIDTGLGFTVLALFDSFTNCTFEQKAQIIDQLVEKGFANEVLELEGRVGSLQTKLIDCGSRGSGTKITGYISHMTFLDTSDVNAPALRESTKLEVDAGCITFTGETAEETIKAIRDNMRKPSPHPRYANAPSHDRQNWSADVEKNALQPMERAVLAISH